MFNQTGQMRNKRFKTSRFNRPGAAAVETALVLPLLMIITLGAVDVAQYINLAQLVSNASREGGRTASRNSAKTVSDVEITIEDFLADALWYVPRETIEVALVIDVRNGETGGEIAEGDLATIESGAPVSVVVSFDFSQVRWLSGPSYWNNDVQVSTTLCRRD